MEVLLEEGTSYREIRLHASPRYKKNRELGLFATAGILHTAKPHFTHLILRRIERREDENRVQLGQTGDRGSGEA
jgi:hypothetical protein